MMRNTNAFDNATHVRRPPANAMPSTRVTSALEEIAAPVVQAMVSNPAPQQMVTSVPAEMYDPGNRPSAAPDYDYEPALRPINGANPVQQRVVAAAQQQRHDPPYVNNAPFEPIASVSHRENTAMQLMAGAVGALALGMALSNAK